MRWLILLFISIATSNQEVQAQCDGEVVTLTAIQTPGMITSPGFQNEGYKPNTICRWHIERGDNLRLLIQVPFKDIDCAGDDMLTVYEGSDDVNGRNLNLVSCGEGTKSKLKLVRSGSVFVVFTTDGTRNDKGFQLNFLAAPLIFDNACWSLQTLTATEFPQYVSSPDFPDTYPGDSSCSWGISSTNECFDVKVEVLFMDIEHGENCEYDQLVFTTMEGKSQTYCREQDWHPAITSTSQLIKIDFHTDAVHERRGFILQYSTVLADRCNTQLLEKSTKSPQTSTIENTLLLQKTASALTTSTKTTTTKVPSSTVKSYQVTSSTIVSKDVSSSTISSKEVTASTPLYEVTFGSNEVTPSVIDTEEIKVSMFGLQEVNLTVIVSHEIASSNISSYKITPSHMSSQKITPSHMSSQKITPSHMSSQKITPSNISPHRTTTSNISSNKITSSNISSHKVTPLNINSPVSELFPSPMSSTISKTITPTPIASQNDIPSNISSYRLSQSAFSSHEIIPSTNSSLNVNPTSFESHKVTRSTISSLEIDPSIISSKEVILSTGNSLPRSLIVSDEDSRSILGSVEDFPSTNSFQQVTTLIIGSHRIDPLNIRSHEAYLSFVRSYGNILSTIDSHGIDPSTIDSHEIDSSTIGLNRIDRSSIGSHEINPSSIISYRHDLSTIDSHGMESSTTGSHGSDPSSIGSHGLYPSFISSYRNDLSSIGSHGLNWIDSSFIGSRGTDSFTTAINAFTHSTLALQEVSQSIMDSNKALSMIFSSEGISSTTGSQDIKTLSMGLQEVTLPITGLYTSKISNIGSQGTNSSLIISRGGTSSIVESQKRASSTIRSHVVSSNIRSKEVTSSTISSHEVIRPTVSHKITSSVLHLNTSPEYKIPSIHPFEPIQLINYKSIKQYTREISNIRREVTTSKSNDQSILANEQLKLHLYHTPISIPFSTIFPINPQTEDFSETHLPGNDKLPPVSSLWEQIRQESSMLPDFNTETVLEILNMKSAFTQTPYSTEFAKSSSIVLTNGMGEKRMTHSLLKPTNQIATTKNTSIATKYSVIALHSQEIKDMPGTSTRVPVYHTKVIPTKTVKTFTGHTQLPILNSITYPVAMETDIHNDIQQETVNTTLNKSNMKSSNPKHETLRTSMLSEETDDTNLFKLDISKMHKIQTESGLFMKKPDITVSVEASNWATSVNPIQKPGVTHFISSIDGQNTPYLSSMSGRISTSTTTMGFEIETTFTSSIKPTPSLIKRQEKTKDWNRNVTLMLKNESHSSDLAIQRETNLNDKTQSSPKTSTSMIESTKPNLVSSENTASSLVVSEVTQSFMKQSDNASSHNASKSTAHSSHETSNPLNTESSYNDLVTKAVHSSHETVIPKLQESSTKFVELYSSKSTDIDQVAKALPHAIASDITQPISVATGNQEKHKTSTPTDDVAVLEEEKDVKRSNNILTTHYIYTTRGTFSLNPISDIITNHIESEKVSTSSNEDTKATLQSSKSTETMVTAQPSVSVHPYTTLKPIYTFNTVIFYKEAETQLAPSFVTTFTENKTQSNVFETQNFESLRKTPLPNQKVGSYKSLPLTGNKNQNLISIEFDKSITKTDYSKSTNRNFKFLSTLQSPITTTAVLGINSLPFETLYLDSESPFTEIQSSMISSDVETKIIANSKSSKIQLKYTLIKEDTNTLNLTHGMNMTIDESMTNSEKSKGVPLESTRNVAQSRSLQPVSIFSNSLNTAGRSLVSSTTGKITTPFSLIASNIVGITTEHVRSEEKNSPKADNHDKNNTSISTYETIKINNTHNVERNSSTDTRLDNKLYNGDNRYSKSRNFSSLVGVLMHSLRQKGSTSNDNFIDDELIENVSSNSKQNDNVLFVSPREMYMKNDKVHVAGSESEKTNLTGKILRYPNVSNEFHVPVNTINISISRGNNTNLSTSERIGVVSGVLSGIILLTGILSGIVYCLLVYPKRQKRNKKPYRHKNRIKSNSIIFSEFNNIKTPSWVTMLYSKTFNTEYNPYFMNSVNIVDTSKSTLSDETLIHSDSSIITLFQKDWRVLKSDIDTDMFEYEKKKPI